MKKIFIAICLFWLSACTTHQKKDLDQVLITEIVFVGNKALESDSLREKIKLKPGWVLTADLETILDDDQKLINFCFFDQGYALVKVSVSTPEQIKSAEGRTIFHIREGERFKIAQVSFSHDLLIHKRALSRILRTKVNQYFSYATLTHDIDAISDYYRERGHPGAKVDISTNINEKSSTLDIKFAVSEEN